MKEIIVNQEIKYVGNMISVEDRRVQLPNGDYSNRDVVHHSGAVAVLALTKDQKMITVKQYRSGIDQITLEIPAGKLDRDQENRLEAIQRELNEETGYESMRWEKLVDMHISPAYITEQITIYKAQECTMVADKLDTDADEFVEVILMSYPEAKKAMMDGTITDAKTLYAILYWGSLLRDEVSDDTK